MKFGMFYPVAVASEADLGKGLWGLDRDRYANTIEELREQAIVADETGWTSMMFAEHHFEIEGYHVTPNPLLLNVYLAQHTKRLRQGQMGLVLPNWNPLRLAEDIAMTDHLTGGRLDIGLSRGYQPRSVGVMGQHYHANAAGTGRAEVEAVNRKIVEEWFEVMRRSWTEDLWDYEGEFISVPPKGLEWKHPISAKLKAGVDGDILKQVATVPKPKQLPHPPLFTTLTQSPETLNWSARIGSSVVTLAANLDIVRWVFQAYVDEAAKHGRKLRFGEYSKRGGVVLCRNVAVGKTHEEAMETARQGSAFWTHWLGEFGFFEGAAHEGAGRPGAEDLRADDQERLSDRRHAGRSRRGDPAAEGYAGRRIHHLRNVWGDHRAEADAGIDPLVRRKSDPEIHRREDGGTCAGNGLNSISDDRMGVTR
jgi:alkanesulfonate monooxygenase SsuD/methylene tetrahydromethanopterin reductase-like flavin-dependent oxidoreductase (luciferase family)